MADGCLRILREDFAVLYPNLYGLAAVQAYRVYLNGFSGKKPADRQRFKCSLAEPFLLAVNGEPVVGGQVVEGRKGNNAVCFGEKPAGKAGG